MLGLIDNKFMIGRDTFLPVSAEIHYFRVPKRYWSICFERIKRAGFRIISSYVPWNLHEEKPGQFDFQGLDNPHKDLIVFLELAREFGFKIILRPGPWIKSEWPDGGLPKYIFSDESIIARDSTGELLIAKNSGGVKPSYQPSYLHPKYMNHVKRYIGGLVEAIQNYIFPKGPVFLVQLDNEINFGGNDKLLESDYNNYVVSELYPAFLEDKYENVKNLPSCYGKNRSFNGILPPTEITVKKAEQLVHYFDWLEFKGTIVRDYINQLRDRWESMGVGCMFSVTIPSSFDFNIPIPWGEIRGERTILGTSIEHEDDITQVTRKLRLTESITGYCWSSQLATGEPGEISGKASEDIYKKQRFLLISSLAAGLKGLNYYMFVGRDHWKGSALDADGTVNPNYDDIRKLNVALEVMDLGTASSKSSVSIGLYKPYQWYSEIDPKGEFAYISDLVDQTFSNILADLSGLNYDYNIYDLDSLDESWHAEDFSETKLMFVPCAEYMSDHLQKKLLDLVNDGMIIVFIGLLPRFNLQFKSSRILAKGLGIQTRAGYSPGFIEANNHSFRSIIYGTIQGKDSTKVIAKAGPKIVGVSRKLGKGKSYFFSYDIAAGGEPGRLCFLKDILMENEITTAINCSESDIDVVIKTNDKGAALFLMNAGSGQLIRHKRKKVVVSVDLSQCGIRQAKIVLHDIFDMENVIKTTSQELRDGLIFEMDYLDARVFWIPKK